MVAGVNLLYEGDIYQRTKYQTYRVPEWVQLSFPRNLPRDQL